jgi:uncharacterized protein YjbI with pentapeptide repeats
MLPKRGLLLIDVALVALAFVVAGFAIFFLFDSDTQVAGATLLGGLVVAAGTARTIHVTREGQITERFSKAIAQLGSDVDDVRLGAIYALERIARDSRRDHGAVLEVLTAYVRKRAHWPAEWPSSATPREPENDVQAALAVLGRRWVRKREHRLDLRRTDLRRAKFGEGNFARAIFRGTQLGGADLARADFREAELEGANLEGAHLEAADFRKAELEGANLEGANPEGRTLKARTWRERISDWRSSRGRTSGARSWRRADFRKAKLKGANLEGAHLEGADFREAELEGADMTDATYDGETMWPGGPGAAPQGARRSDVPT